MKFLHSIRFFSVLPFALFFPAAATADCVFGDCANGTGKFVYNDGGAYEGAFKDGFRNGNGTYVWPGKDRYVGNWVNGSQDGQGAYYTPDGKLEYAGLWAGGQRASAPKSPEGASSAAPIAAPESGVPSDVTSGCVSGNCTDGYGSFA